jgi:hypothetical protein
MNRTLGSLALVALATACLARHPRPETAPTPPIPAAPTVSPWPGVLASARRAADAGRFADADRVLSEFAVQHPQSPEGAEADFWRALFRSDPANRDATIREQLAAFDSYLNGGPSLPRYAEAKILRRMVETVDSARAVIVAVRAAADVRERAKNDEVKRLSDELEKALAEMERIRRRLSPKPDEKKPPPQ